MKTTGDILRDADPLRRELDRSGQARDRLRHEVIAAATSVHSSSSPLLPKRFSVLAPLVLVVVGLMVGIQLWPRENATLQAAVRFEVRLATEESTPGLEEARVGNSDRVVYLYDEVIVTNEDIAHATVVPGNDQSQFSIEVQLTVAGAQKMRAATAMYLGQPLAILIDGVVVTAPIVRAVIGDSAIITGDYARVDAERIVDGIVGR